MEAGANRDADMTAETSLVHEAQGRTGAVGERCKGRKLRQTQFSDGSRICRNENQRTTSRVSLTQQSRWVTQNTARRPEVNFAYSA